ncbi:MAG: DUF2927 domain-containing protein [Alphaproteobacteria bacterium]|nr:DUF2927 domain-containing protein [Alphaproteobacteria bacterium]NNF23926.1 DUF2927 domain-containing protein [Paracoccaceae bacterium]
MRFALIIGALMLSACGATDGPSAGRLATPDIELPPMKTFSAPMAERPQRSNARIAQDILDLVFQLESGRPLPVLTRFEGPITVRVLGDAPASLMPDLDRLIARLRSEAGIDISRVAAAQTAGITIEVLRRDELQRVVPKAACFVVPRVTGWREFRRNRRNGTVDWSTLENRERLAIFLPGDVSPQEVRDCLHEEIAQAIGPLNDLYRLPDSVFNDDNFHTVLTGFDMLVLRTIYAPELQSGMSRSQVAARLPRILARLNPSGRRDVNRDTETRTPRRWIMAIERALGPGTPPARRRSAAREAVAIARAEGWQGPRLAFSLYALGRLHLGTEPELAIGAFLQAGAIYQSSDETRIQAAHVGMQLSAFALAAGQPDVALEIVNEHLAPVARAENAALLSTLLMVKAEALELLGRASEARDVRLDSLGWARYGFGSDRAVRARASEIAGLARTREDGSGT